MGTLNKFSIKTHFDWNIMNFFNVFLFQKMPHVGGFFIVSISALFLSLFDFFSKVFSRTQIGKLSQSNKPIPVELEDNTEEKTEEANTEESEAIEEKESTNFFFKFRFQIHTFEDFSRKFTEDENYNVGMELESFISTTTNKYSFNSGNDVSCIMEKPNDPNFCIQELYADSNDGAFSEEKFMEWNSKVEGVAEEIAENEEKVAEKTLVEAGQSEENVSETDTDSFTSTPDYVSTFMDSASDAILSDKDFEENLEVDSLWKISRNKEDSEMEEADDLKLEESENHKEDSKREEIHANDNRPTNTLNNSQVYNSFASDSEDSNGLETLWEHQDLIEQLKMELKKVRATGLPTILEESESPKIMDDLKPWKIEEKYQHVDRMSELHKFYKSYRERMRKFDILNYQKMYAIGFLQSKDPLQSISISSHRPSSPPAITSLLYQNLRLGRRKKSDDFDPMMTKFMKDIHSDLEMVYVGQLCLSWEILHWQYEKATEIWESDPYSTRRYNEVAGEFQQFQVLMQRFIENEPFEGPRLQNYIKNRCVLRNLLQVPVIREDSMKDKRKGRRKGRDDDDDDAITSDMLVEIMEESIRIFWRFIRTDKDANIMIQKTRKGAQVEPLERADVELLAEVQASLLKKHKKLKDVLRSGNCILRKLRKNQEESSDQVLYFFSQVDLKLVARVLNMSKVTKDQLFWCHGKLSKINFVNRKINVNPSFLLFPC